MKRRQPYCSLTLVDLSSANTRVYAVSVLTRDFYLTPSTLRLLLNFYHSPVAVGWRMCSSSIPWSCIHSFMDQGRPSEIYIPRPFHVDFPFPLPSLSPINLVFIQLHLDVWFFIFIKGYTEKQLPETLSLFAVVKFPQCHCAEGFSKYLIVLQSYHIWEIGTRLWVFHKAKFI